jgi:hypothetical protein
MGLFWQDSGDVADLKISKLLVPEEPVSSWFESMPGSHRFLVAALRLEMLTARAFRRPPISATFRRFLPSAASRRFDGRCAGGAFNPPGFEPETKDFAANSPVSPVDRVAFVDGTVQRASPSRSNSQLRSCRTVQVSPFGRFDLRLSKIAGGDRLLDNQPRCQANRGHEQQCEIPLQANL